MADALGGSVAVASASEGDALAVIGRDSDSLASAGSWGADESTEPLCEDGPGVGMRRLSAADGDSVLLSGESGLACCCWGLWGGDLSKDMASLETRQMKRMRCLGAAMQLQCCEWVVHKTVGTPRDAEIQQRAATGRRSLMRCKFTGGGWNRRYWTASAEYQGVEKEEERETRK